MLTNARIRGKLLSGFDQMGPDFNLRKKRSDRQIDEVEAEILAHDLVLELLEHAQHAQSDGPHGVEFFEGTEQRVSEQRQHGVPCLVFVGLFPFGMQEEGHVAQEPGLVGPETNTSQTQHKRHILALHALRFETRIELEQAASRHDACGSDDKTSLRQPLLEEGLKEVEKRRGGIELQHLVHNAE